MKKIIKIYSPVDGIVKPLVELNDGVFSEEMLGIGFYIEPKSNVFFSPLAEGELTQIFNTKHAYYFKDSQGPAFLMHIGLDTVNLEGKPFDVKAQIGDKLSLKKEIVAVDFKMIEKHKMLKATPIVLDLNEFTGWKFEMQKDGEVKQGDLIGTFTHNDVQKEEKNVRNIVLDILESKNKYSILAEKILNLVGGQSNYTQVHNCMTRLRFEIINKDNVDNESIKKIATVKGVVWVGNQIQIIIGQDVYKVKDALLINIENSKHSTLAQNEKINIKARTNFFMRLIKAFIAIIVPNIPVLMASGLLMGIKSILVLTNSIQDMGIGGQLNTNIDAFSIFVNVLSETGLKLLGIFIAYNTIRYLGGPELTQIFISLIITGATIGLSSLPSVNLFSLGSIDFKLSFYTNSIIPHMVSAVILYHVDKFLKNWVPSSLDIIFRPFLSAVIVFGSIYFILGPFLFLIEQGLGSVVGFVSSIPYGIGCCLFGVLWQPLVLIGMAGIPGIPVSMALIGGEPSVLITSITISGFAQLGAVIGVGLKTKNKITTVAALATIPGGLLGITEPIMYGINLPKIKPFIAALISTAIISLFVGLLGIEARVMSGSGILSFTGILIPPKPNSFANIFTGSANGLVLNTILWFLAIVAVSVLALCLSYIMYYDRLSEKKSIAKTNKKYMKMLAKITNQKVKNLDSNYLSSLNNVITQDDVERIKEIENELILITNKNVLLAKKEEQIEKKHQKLFNQVTKIETSKMDEKEKLLQQEILIDKYEMYVDKTNLKKVENELIELKVNNEKNIVWINEFVNSKIKLILNKIKEINSQNNSDVLLDIKNDYWNSLNSLQITYQLVEKKPILINNKNLKISNKENKNVQK
ncbi:glucose PTS transporter subunit IIA [Mesoplasma corruscae]|uniref:PTS system, beta-glucoside-specific IIABC component n=1 Tax=Mesoplasma corruscae TaxID=216874 RepID=A0A2S5RED1_9MOLU|nr:glucose PTS transporter subunit IIA [Mesoplasma corruscae]PPE05648.1 PTS system, beta-glucoside-specific IIABC component [Mesoplasma corruscae]